MPKNKKKIKRKELIKGNDHFTMFLMAGFEFIKKYHKKILYITVPLAILIIAAVSVFYFTVQNKIKSLEQLDSLVNRYTIAKNESGAQAGYQELKKDFENLCDKYSSNFGGKAALVMYASISLDAGDFENSIKLYSKALKYFENTPFYGSLILSGLGHAYTAKKDYKKAAYYFEKAASSKNPAIKDCFLFNEGLLYAMAGDKQKEQDAFLRLQSEESASPYIELIKEKPFLKAK